MHFIVLCIDFPVIFFRYWWLSEYLNGPRRRITDYQSISYNAVGGHQPLTSKFVQTTMGSWVWRLMMIVVVIAGSASSAVPGVVRFSVIAPLKATKNEETLGAILPSVDLAAQAIAQPNGPLPGWKIQIQNRNGNCSSTDGPLAAFELHDKSGEYLRNFFTNINLLFIVLVTSTIL